MATIEGGQQRELEPPFAAALAARAALKELPGLDVDTQHEGVRILTDAFTAGAKPHQIGTYKGPDASPVVDTISHPADHQYPSTLRVPTLSGTIVVDMKEPSPHVRGNTAPQILKVYLEQATA